MAFRHEPDEAAGSKIKHAWQVQESLGHTTVWSLRQLGRGRTLRSRDDTPINGFVDFVFVFAPPTLNPESTKIVPGKFLDGKGKNSESSKGELELCSGKAPLVPCGIGGVTLCSIHGWLILGVWRPGQILGLLSHSVSHFWMFFVVWVTLS